MFIYIIILLILAFCHFVFVDHLSKAMQQKRVELIQGLKKLREDGAPEWLMEIWEASIPKIMFERGSLKHLVAYYYKKSARDELASVMRDIKKLPTNIHETHKDMDMAAAFLIMANSPYFSFLLIIIGLIRQSNISIKNAVPHQESRAVMVKV